MQVDVQLNPATMPWPQLRDGVIAAEEAGFGAFWMVDHLAGRSMSGTTMLECCTTLGALAAITTSIPLGTLVANVHHRAPGVLAAAMATLDRIGERQVLVGLGAGTSPSSPFASEQLAAGHEIPPTVDARHAAVHRQLDVLEALWSAEERFDDFTKPRRRPLVLLGVNSPALARTAAARTDGINVRWSSPKAVELLAAAAEEAAGRERDRPFLITAWVRWDEALTDPAHQERQRMETNGVTRLILSCIEPIEPDEIRRAGAMLTSP